MTVAQAELLLEPRDKLARLHVLSIDPSFDRQRLLVGGGNGLSGNCRWCIPPDVGQRRFVRSPTRRMNGCRIDKASPLNHREASLTIGTLGRHAASRRFNSRPSMEAPAGYEMGIETDQGSDHAHYDGCPGSVMPLARGAARTCAVRPPPRGPVGRGRTGAWHDERVVRQRVLRWAAHGWHGRIRGGRCGGSALSDGWGAARMVAFRL